MPGLCSRNTDYAESHWIAKEKVSYFRIESIGRMKGNPLTRRKISRRFRVDERDEWVNIQVGRVEVGGCIGFEIEPRGFETAVRDLVMSTAEK